MRDTQLRGERRELGDEGGRVGTRHCHSHSGWGSPVWKALPKCLPAECQPGKRGWPPGSSLTSHLQVAKCQWVLYPYRHPSTPPRLCSIPWPLPGSKLPPPFSRTTATQMFREQRHQWDWLGMGALWCAHMQIKASLLERRASFFYQSWTCLVLGQTEEEIQTL